LVLTYLFSISFLIILLLKIKKSLSFVFACSVGPALFGKRAGFYGDI